MNRETIASVLYYNFGISQKEIAKRLNISTMTVSRLLESARRQGIVEIKVHTPVASDESEEERLVKEFGLKKAIVVRNAYGIDPLDNLARAAGFYVDALISPSDVIGLMAGRTMRRVITQLSLPCLSGEHDLAVVQLTGGFPGPSPFDPTSNLNEFTSRFMIRGYFFHLPIYADSAEARTALESHGIPKPVLAMWESCTILLSGVGVAGEDSIYRLGDLLSKEEMKGLCEQGAVGDMLGRWYDEEGSFLDNPVNSRVLAMPHERAKAVPCKVMIAGGKQKSKAILGLLNAGLVDILITDGEASQGLVKASSR
jgi:DNA-binding transcriptional regulator LsrR (DeoR family)